METNAQEAILARVGRLLADFFIKLSGNEGEAWLEAFKKFLRKENPWSETKCLFTDKTHCQDLAIRVANFIRQQGYLVGDHQGVKTDDTFFEPDTTWHVILSKKKNHIFGDRFHLGDLHFCGVDEWELKMFGQDKVAEIVDFAQRIGKEFECKVNVTLKDKAPHYESILVGMD
jgi:hypothetical protein